MDELVKQFGNRLQQNKDISPYFTLKTKTVAEFYLEAESREDIIEAVRICGAYHVPIFMLGGGSNTAVLKDKIEGLVLRNMYVKKEIILDEVESSDVLFSSGYSMGRIVKETTEAGLLGFEYHLGLPGSIGGAIFMNSKWTKNLSYIGDNLLYANILDRSGNERKVEKEYFKFAYDFSILQKTHEVVLEAVFRMKKEDPVILKKRSQDALAYRKQTQPFGVATGGCFFRNISVKDQEKYHLPTTSAGYLIDKSGLKNKEVGGFKVSAKHANFIINTGNGNPQDLKRLLSIIKTKVNEKYGVELKEEVVIV